MIVTSKQPKLVGAKVRRDGSVMLTFRILDRPRVYETLECRPQSSEWAGTKQYFDTADRDGAPMVQRQVGPTIYDGTVVLKVVGAKVSNRRTGHVRAR